MFLEGERPSGSQVGARFPESEEGDDGNANWIFYPAVVGGRVSDPADLDLGCIFLFLLGFTSISQNCSCVS